MSITHNPAIREVLSQLVGDPDYEKVAHVPVIAWQQIALIVAAYGGTAFGIIGYLQWGFPLWVSYPIMIYAMFIGFTPLHDATHKALSSNRLINDILGTISAQTLFPGFNTPTYRAFHLEHHRYTGDKDFDPDERLVKWPKFVGPLFLAFTDLHWVHWYFTKAWKRWPKNLRPWVIGTVITVVVIYTVGLTSPYWYEFLILYVIPHRLALMVTAYAFAHIQHPEGLTWKDEPFQSTVRVTGNPIKRASLLGQAEHAMHHLLPHVPWYKYHRVCDLANGLLHRKNIPQRGIFRSPKEIILPQPTELISALQTVEITEVRIVASGVKSFTLEPVTHSALEEFDAGAHITVLLKSGQQRQYSLLNSPCEAHRYQIAVKLDPNGRGGSKEIHETWKKGDVIQVSKPRNNFMLYENANRHILIAGGIGITPMLAMAHRLCELDEPFMLHVCAKTENDVPFAREIQNSSFGPNVEVHLDNAQGRSSIDIGQALATPREGDLIYVCGPSGFMEWVRASAETLGWAPEQVHFESFSAPPAGDIPNHAFEVHLAKTGKRLQVSEDMSILDALQHANIKVPYACRQGTCGTCIVSITAGEADHRDAFLSDIEKAEGNQICLCVSRAKGHAISLDL
jgi:ferredoxin-NADP reductase/fatty acid desaturase